MEVTLAAADASSVLSTALALMLKAIDVHPKLKEKLLSYRGEMSKAKRVVDLILDQEALQTSGVVAGIRMLESHGKILKGDLMSLGKGKAEQDLIKIVEKIRVARKGLIQQIRLASVGLAKDEKGISIDTKVVKSTDEAVKKILGDGLGLDIPLFLTRLNRKPDAKGKIRLTEKEYQDWTGHQIDIADPEPKNLSPEAKTRIVCNCLARDQAIQILAAVDVDLWKDIAFVKIEGLVAMDEAIQIAVPVTREVYNDSLDRQDKRIARRSAQGSRD